jgi:F-type H+-transporting ATPase subunit alpha
MPVEDQVVQIYAATNGYLDRINVDRVGNFLADLTDFARASEPELLKQLAAGEWSDEVQIMLSTAVEQFAQDFGFDLDEEGQPLGDVDEGAPDTTSREREALPPAEEKEEEAVPA